jgi:hypothetical protein
MHSATAHTIRGVRTDDRPAPAPTGHIGEIRAQRRTASVADRIRERMARRVTPAA